MLKNLHSKLRVLRLIRVSPPSLGERAMVTCELQSTLKDGPMSMPTMPGWLALSAEPLRAAWDAPERFGIRESFYLCKK